jgi:hypothetical protein
MATQGTLLSSKFDRSTRNFVARIKIDSKINASSVVYAMVKGRSEAWYPKGYEHDYWLIKNGTRTKFDSKIFS